MSLITCGFGEESGEIQMIEELDINLNEDILNFSIEELNLNLELKDTILNVEVEDGESITILYGE